MKKRLLLCLLGGSLLALLVACGDSSDKEEEKTKDEPTGEQVTEDENTDDLFLASDNLTLTKEDKKFILEGDQFIKENIDLFMNHDYNKLAQHASNNLLQQVKEEAKEVIPVVPFKPGEVLTPKASEFFGNLYSIIRYDLAYNQDEKIIWYMVVVPSKQAYNFIPNINKPIDDEENMNYVLSELDKDTYKDELIFPLTKDEQGKWIIGKINDEALNRSSADRDHSTKFALINSTDVQDLYEEELNKLEEKKSQMEQENYEKNMSSDNLFGN